MESTPKEIIADDKNIITDIAFGVDDALLGKGLASPLQRGLAMSIDALAVLMLTHVGAVFWGLVAGLSIFKFGKKSEQKRWRFARYLLRLIGAFAVFISVIAFINQSFNNDIVIPENDLEITQAPSFANSIRFAALLFELTTKLEQPDCDIACYHPLIEDTLDAVAELNMSNDEVYEFIEDNSKSLPIETEQARLEYVDQLFTYYQASVQKYAALKNPTKLDQTEPSDQATLENEVVQAPVVVEENNEQQCSDEQSSDEQIQPKQEAPVYSLVEFGKGIISDLGLGFGWAALYFTAFPAWWRGQTPGKRLMGIRVIQLDGTYMSAWDSFGRYGGYGAGFATGLLGFFQIYWDSNRQAIQDKISATVVIKGDL